MPFVIGDLVEAYWEDYNGIGWWWKAIILKVNNKPYQVRFENYNRSWDRPMTLRKRFVRRRRQNADVSGDISSNDANETMTNSSTPSDIELSANEDTHSSDSDVSDSVSYSLSTDTDIESLSDSKLSVTHESDLYTSRDQRK